MEKNNYLNIDSLENEDQNTDRPEIGHGAFGGIYTSFTSFKNYEEISDKIGTTLLRWPGGTLSEQRTDRYGLEYDQLQKEGSDRPGLTDLIEWAHESGDVLSIIIPTARYTDDLTKGTLEFSNFMKKLADGYYGEIPDGLTLEMGNEYYANFDDAADYARVANAFLEIAHEILEANPDMAALINISVQAGRTPEENKAILNEMSEDSFKAITHLSAHRLTPSLESADKLIDALGESISTWNEKIVAVGGDEPELYLSAWNVGSWTRQEAAIDWEKIYKEEFGKNVILDKEELVNRTNVSFEKFWQDGTLTGPDGQIVHTKSGLLYKDYGPEKEAVVLEVISKYAALGLDLSAIYGLDIPHPSNFGSTVGSGASKLTESYSGSGAFTLLAEMVVGMSSVDLKHENKNTPDAHSGVNRWLFSDDDKLVLFLSSGDLKPGETSIASIDIGDDPLAAYGDVVVRSPSKDWQIKHGVPSTPGVDLSPEAQTYENVQVIGFMPFITNGVLTYKFSNPFEMIRITLPLNEATKSQLDTWMRGESADNDIHPDIVGTNGNDVIQGTLSADLILGKGGNDRFINSEGFDTLDGGNGTDTIDLKNTSQNLIINLANGQISGNNEIRSKLISIENAVGGRGEDTIYGNGYNNSLAGHVGNDKLFGGAGNDKLFGGAGNDKIDGGVGDDTLYGGAGADTLRGGMGVDVADYSKDKVASTIDLARPLYNTGGAEGDVHHSIENIVGGSLTDKIFGNGLHNQLRGGAGDDTLQGRSGNDSLYGGDGDDFLVGGRGTDVIFAGSGDDVLIGDKGADGYFGGMGFDTVDYRLSNNDLIVDLMFVFKNNDIATRDTYHSIEGIVGGRGDDALAGDNNANLISGSSGDDFIWGRGGNDILEGGAGNDHLFGGSGSDTFIFNRGVDVIEDFEQEYDKIFIEENLLAGRKIEELVSIRDLESGALELWFNEHSRLEIKGVSDIATIADSIILF